MKTFLGMAFALLSAANAFVAPRSMHQMTTSSSPLLAMATATAVCPEVSLKPTRPNEAICVVALG